MYRILVVDDEFEERDGIKMLIQKLNYPFKVVQAENGEQALLKIRKEKIDVLLTDIKMPFLNGIELIDAIRAEGFSPICVISSAYGEFEYAQSAISLGVTEYLLKPIELERFRELFDSLTNLCKKREKAFQEEMQREKDIVDMENYKLERLILQFLESECTPETLPYLLNQAFDGRRFIPILISSFSLMHNLEQDLGGLLGEDMLVVHKNDSQMLLIMFTNLKTAKDKELMNKCEKIVSISKQKYFTEIFLIVGSNLGSFLALKKEYDEMQEQLDYQFFVTESTILFHDKDYFLKKESDMIPLYLEKVYNCARISDFAVMKSEIKMIFSYVEEQTGFSSIYIKYTFTEVLKQICKLSSFNINLAKTVECIYEAKSIEEVQLMVMEVLDNLSEIPESAGPENRLVNMTKQYINEHYRNSSLSISLISEQLDVSAAYLSTIYKKNTGKQLVKYITQIRMEKAKELLQQTNMKIADVAANVGYLNIPYFTVVFRNQTGTSPGKYREGKYDELE